MVKCEARMSFCWALEPR